MRLRGSLLVWLDFLIIGIAAAQSSIDFILQLFMLLCNLLVLCFMYPKGISTLVLRPNI